MTNSRSAKAHRATTVSILIVVYVLLFEWNIFELSAIASIVNGLKLAIPVVLLLAISLKGPYPKEFVTFVSFFVLFMLWGLIPSLWSEYYEETIIQWLKFIPRLLFAIVIGAYLLRDREPLNVVVKAFVFIGAFTVLQFSVLVFTFILGIEKPFYVEDIRGLLYGPYGILGNQASKMVFGGLPFPILRATGFWLEPSNASGFLFSFFFLAQAVYLIEKKKYWRYLSYVCLAGGMLAFSNAGYLAFGIASFYGIALARQWDKRLTITAVGGIVSLWIGYVAVWGRYIVAERYYDVPFLRAVTGVRASRWATLTDPFAGRLDLIKANLQIWVENPLGIGFRVPGGEFFEEASGTAFILWMAYTGFVGVAFLVFREIQVAGIAWGGSKGSSVVRRVAQAWIVMFTQHMVYGSLMSPMYLFLSVLVISTAARHRRVASQGKLLRRYNSVRAKAKV